MDRYNVKEFDLYKDFVDVVCKCNDWDIALLGSPDYQQIFDAWYNLYNTNKNLALKALFYLCSKECSFRNEDIFGKLLNYLSETEPEECKTIIYAGLIEKYANISSLINLLNYDDDDIDRCVIDHLAGLLLRESLKNEKTDISKLYEMKYYIGHNENATRYFEKYYGIKPELWSYQIKIISEDREKSKYDISALNEYEINLLADNDAE
jgi:hypothetical protein